MGKSLLNATQEERFEISVKISTTLAKLLAHQKGMENPSVRIKHKRKEVEKQWDI